MLVRYSYIITKFNCKNIGVLFHKKTSSNAFSLIELLVVIAIISLLVSILLPSLKTAQILAKKVVCQNNLRSIFLASVLWSEEENGWVPPGNWRVNLVLADYGLTMENTRCPADDDPWPEEAYDNTSASNAYSSYGINSNFINVNWSPKWGNTTDSTLIARWGGEAGPGSPWYYDHGRIRFEESGTPGETVLYMDAPSAYRAYWELSRPPGNPLSYLNDRHFTNSNDAGACIVFIDGHSGYFDDDWIQEDCTRSYSTDGQSGNPIGFGGYHFRLW